MDTEKIKNVGEDIKAIAKDYDNLIVEMYEKIKDIGTGDMFMGTGGTNVANSISEKFMKDKDNTQKLAVSMHNIGDLLINYSSNINKIAEKRINDFE